MDYKVDKETAESDFGRFADHYDIDTDWDDLDENERGDMRSTKAVILKAIRRGQFLVDEQGAATFESACGKSFVLSDPGGGGLIAMDRKKDGHSVAKAYTVFGKITNTDDHAVSRLKSSRDVKVCLAIVALFLA